MARWGDFGVFLVPVISKGAQSIQGCLLIYGGIDGLQIGHKWVLVEHILAGIAQLVDDTVLDLGLRKSRMDRSVK